MGKGTPSMGKHNADATHTICRRCGRHSYFKRKGTCASCGFGKTARLRKYHWQNRTRKINGFKARNCRKQNAEHKGQKH